MDKEYFNKMFIDEAKPALNRHSGGGGSSGNLVECEKLPTEGVSDDKIYRARWSETIENPVSAKVWVTQGDGTAPVDATIIMSTYKIITVQAVSDVPGVYIENIVYACLEDGEVYLMSGVPFWSVNDLRQDASRGLINSPDELDVDEIQYGTVIIPASVSTIERTNIGVPDMSKTTKFNTYIDGEWGGIGLLSKYIEACPDHAFHQSSIRSFEDVLHYHDTSNVTNMAGMFQNCDYLTTVPLFDTSNVTDMHEMFYGCCDLTAVPLFDTSNVTNMARMFQSCGHLTTVPLFDTSNVTDMDEMFYGCYELTAVPLFDTSNVTYMAGMFQNCEHLTTVPLFDTSNFTTMYRMFHSCYELTAVPEFDMKHCWHVTEMFQNCKGLTECRIRNIVASITVGSGTTYGHLLTLDSLIHLIRELIVGSTQRLTVGSANLNKLANVYVRTIAITDDMIAEDPHITGKRPFEVCESTDEGAVLITDYVASKNWEIA